MGWKQAFNTNAPKALQADVALPLLNKGNCLENSETKVSAHQTQPPAHFTEGTLIDAMKHVGKTVDDETLKKVLKDSYGIGTEATRAGILETLFKRGFLKRQAKHVISTAKGRALLDIAPAQLKDLIWSSKSGHIFQEKLPFELQGADII